MISELSHKLLQHSRYFMGFFHLQASCISAPFENHQQQVFLMLSFFWSTVSEQVQSHKRAVFRAEISRAQVCAARHGGTQKEKSDLPLCSEALQLLPAVEDDVGLFGFHIARNPPVQSCPASLRTRRHFDRLLTEPEEDKQKAENLEDSLSPQKHTWGGSRGSSESNGLLISLRGMSSLLLLATTP